MTPYDLGRDARYAGLSATDFPATLECAELAEWLDGWIDADAELTE